MRDIDHFHRLLFRKFSPDIAFLFLDFALNFTPAAQFYNMHSIHVDYFLISVRTTETP